MSAQLGGLVWDNLSLRERAPEARVRHESWTETTGAQLLVVDPDLDEKVTEPDSARSWRRAGCTSLSCGLRSTGSWRLVGSTQTPSSWLTNAVGSVSYRVRP